MPAVTRLQTRHCIGDMFSESPISNFTEVEELSENGSQLNLSLAVTDPEAEGLSGAVVSTICVVGVVVATLVAFLSAYLYQRHQGRSYDVQKAAALMKRSSVKWS